MKPITPQALADLLQLYLVRNNGRWYACLTPPEYNTRFEEWEIIDKVKIEAIFLTRSILYVGTDRDSLTIPR